VGPETSSHGLDDNDFMASRAVEAGPASTNFNKQVPDGGEITSDTDSHMSIFNSKSKDSELSVVPTHTQNVETASQKTRETYNKGDISVNPATVVPSEQEVCGGETGLKMIGRFEEILASLRAVALTREEAQKVENLLWDVKGELYAAEKRGRVAG
jgi:hypothetical protein